MINLKKKTNCRWLFVMVNLGDKFVDDDGNIGIVGILWDDGDFTIENVVTHANPKPIKIKQLKEKTKYCAKLKKN